jgi:hypothetical protein
MKISGAVLLASISIGIIPARAEETAGKHDLRLPAPLDGISCDFRVLEKHFQVVETKLYAADEFSVGNRAVAEETIAWTLEAKAPLAAKEVYNLLHPNPLPSPFYKVRFSKLIDGKEIAADAREKGYSLIGDRRWLGSETGPGLAKGDKLQVWVHLGQEGSAGLIEQKATKLTITAKGK